MTNPLELDELLLAPPVETYSWDAVNLPMIRHYCETIGLENPIYVDEAVARVGPYGCIVAPAAMLFSWTMPDYTGRYPKGNPIDPLQETASRLSRLGFPNVLAVTLEQQYDRYPRIGERLRKTVNTSAIRGPKKTAVGEGYFITQCSLFENEDGERLGQSHLTVLRYRPGARLPKSSVSTPASPQLLPDLPPVTIEVTTSFIVAAAIATRDYEDVHHDRDAAQRAGTKDIFLNILTTIGLVQRCVELWCGPLTIHESIKLNLLGQAYPGDHLCISADSLKRLDNGRMLIEMKGGHQRGPFCQAVVIARGQ